MINFHNQVPSVYTSTSRDFQYLTWLINIVLNAVKHNVDDIYNLPNTKADSRLTELLAMTLGFKIKRNYNQKQLAALVSIIPRILKYKGTTEAVMLAGNALLKAAGSANKFECEFKNKSLEIVLPEDLVDTNLFMDLMPYILPAGITCRVIRKSQAGAQIPPIKIGYEDKLAADWHPILSWNSETQTSNGLAELAEAPQSEPSFANYKDFDFEEQKGKLNIGLLDNSMIPALENALVDNKTEHLNISEEEEK